jgi:hypothetical protein
MSAATIVQVQLSFAANAVDGVSVNVLGPPLTVAMCEPEFEHWIAYHAPVVSTGSLKVIASIAASATLAAFDAGVVEATVGGTSTGGVPSTAKLASSMARPSSELGTSRSVQRTQIVADGARLRPVIDAEIAVRFALALPFSGPAAAAVLGELKSSALTSTHVAAVSPTDVALRLYWKSRRSVLVLARGAIARRCRRRRRGSACCPCRCAGARR